MAQDGFVLMTRVILGLRLSKTHNKVYKIYNNKIKTLLNYNYNASRLKIWVVRKLTRISPL